MDLIQSIKQKITDKKILPILLILALIHIIQLIIWRTDTIFSEASEYGMGMATASDEKLAMGFAMFVLWAVTVILLVSIVFCIVSGIFKLLKGVNIVGILSQFVLLIFSVLEKISVSTVSDSNSYGMDEVLEMSKTANYLILMALFAIVLYIIRIIKTKTV